ncbi:MAG TPA: hypothetical protein VH253_07365 [Phycisphaerae bacterium]|nr:hypothetical protein [Phycisphaerae bacterium]
MAYFTVPLIIILTIWAAVSLRTRRFTLYLRRGPHGLMGAMQEWDSAQFTRQNEPVHYWIAVGAIIALNLSCIVITLPAARMGLAWQA